MRRISIFLLIAALLMAIPVSAPASETFVRKPPYDAGRVCQFHYNYRDPEPPYPFGSPYFSESCFRSPYPGANPVDPLDPVTTKFNVLADLPRNGHLIVGGADRWDFPPYVRAQFLYNFRRSIAVVYFYIDGPGTIELSSDVQWATVSLPTLRKFKACAEIYDSTPGRGPYPFTGHVLLSADCSFEDEPVRTLQTSTTITITEPSRISLEAALDNTADWGGAYGFVDNLTWSWTPAT